MTGREPTEARRRVDPAWIVLGLATALLVLRAVARYLSYDLYEVELSPFDAGWTLQYPWRASRGEWVGRDFVMPRGPLFQALSWAGSGFGRAPWRWTVPGNELAFALPALALGFRLVRRALEGTRARAGTLAILAGLVLWGPSDALRWMATLGVAVVFAFPPRSPTDRPREPRSEDGALAGVGVTALLLLSFERGIMALASVMLIAGVGALAGRAVIPARAQARRAGTFAGVFLGSQIVVEAAARIASGSYLDYLSQQVLLSQAYAITMRAGEGARHAPLIGLGIALVLISVFLWLRHRRSVADAALLVGVSPMLVAGLVRNDPPHIFMAAAVPVGALALVGFRQLEAARTAAFTVTAGLLAISLLALVPTHREPLGEWAGLAAMVSADERERLRARAADYQGDHRHVLAWLRELRRRGELDCVGLDESLGSVHAIADVDGPVGLRWNQRLQAHRAEAIAARACSHYVHRIFSFDMRDQWSGWIFGRDLVAIARHYRPTRMLGPAVVGMARRPAPAPVERRDLEATGVGEWHELALGEGLELRFARPIPVTSLVRMAYEIQAPRAARMLDAVPTPEIAFVEAGTGAEVLVQPVMFMNFAGPQARIVTPDTWAAEHRWIAGVTPHRARVVDRLRLRVGTSDAVLAPDTIRVRIDGLTELPPPPVERPAHAPIAGASITPADTWARFAVLDRDGPHFQLEPHPEERLEASAFAPLRPALGDVLRGRVYLAADRGDGASFQVEAIDPAGSQDARRVVLRSGPLAAGDARRFELPLGPWVDRRIWLRVTTRPEGDADWDWVRFADLQVSADARHRTVAGALRAGVATSTHEPRVQGYGDVLLHPRAPGETPATLRLPLEGLADGCLLTGLDHRGPSGDGVWAEASAVGPESARTLFREHLAPGASRALPPIPLPAEATELVLRTEPGRDHTHDWLHFVLPRVAPCRLVVPERLELWADAAWTVARASGVEPVRENDSIFVHPNDPDTAPAEVSFDLVPTAEQCLLVGVRHAGARGDGARAEVEVVADGERVELLSAHLAPGERREPEARSLSPFAGRPIELVFRTRPGETNDTDWIYFVEPTIRSCEGS
ncbi:MAG TPA: hypothetical protein RMH99_07985 [Sandaracinaceae bacterium LLY-WYZ-13_1]|nr:hypothetical protein [Sandaracinaceae bacterium LLY-WYZ-13_1]